MFHWDNAPVHTTAKVTDWMAAKVKRELAGLTLTLDTFKKE
jgi:hypothetical protein